MTAITDIRPRCPHCVNIRGPNGNMLSARVLAEKVTRPWTIKCSRCKETITSDYFLQGPNANTR